MAEVQLAGLISGFDWRSFIDQIITAESKPISNLQADKATNARKSSALSLLGTKITDLQTSVNALKADGLFTARTAKSTATTSPWSASSSAGTATGSYKINVTQLATSAKLAGATGVSKALATTPDVSGLTIASLPTAGTVTAGFFTVNGQQVTVATTDSLADVLNRISTATSGAVTAAYNPGTDHIDLTSSTPLAPITLGAANDSSNFLSVMRLRNNGTDTITSSGSLGTAGLNATLATTKLDTDISAVDGSGNGSFSINGVAITFNKNTDTINTVLGRINASTAGVTAAYDQATDSFSLTNKVTGNIGVTVTDVAGGFLDAIGLRTGTSLTAGKNAEYTINGSGTLVSQTNTLDSSSHGITGLTVTASTEAEQTITVGGDTDKMKSAINDFISKFNSVESYIEQQTKISMGADKKVSASLLSSNREIQSWASQFRSMAFGAISGLSGTISKLGDLGINFTSTESTLSITDSSKLDTALQNKATDVAEFFSKATTGFSAKFDTFAKTLMGSSGTGTGGLLGAQTDTLTKQNTSIDQQIAAIQRSLDAQKAQLTTGFIEMENAQAKIKQMQQQLNQALGTG
ncbi:flagellar filament capping protein FliD [Nibricoccus sp. IMCC34717]|uniref:flagellar filament capping protein FliD n=1 Tax=Nibricoccus sp. IMCC34717 TaxID=3034021 RepID=UPI00384C8100